jgi:hypothetical protein
MLRGDDIGGVARIGRATHASEDGARRGSAHVAARSRGCGRSSMVGGTLAGACVRCDRELEGKVHVGVCARCRLERLPPELRAVVLGEAVRS